MDVTSLLNSSSAAAILQRRDSVGSSTPSATGDTTATSTAVPTPSPERTPPRRTGSRSPIRNRTPWDAGGYSLPLTLDTKSIPSLSESASRPLFYPNSNSGSPTGCCDTHPSGSPKSAHHKFSDSHSSLSSSYTSSTSSTNSLSHSRISSLSTVSEFQPLTSAAAEPSLDLAAMASNSSLPPKKSGSSASDLATLNSSPPDGSISPRQPLDGAPHSIGNATSQHIDTARPTSPSDAVMIRRGLDGLNDPTDSHGLSGQNNIGKFESSYGTADAHLRPNGGHLSENGFSMGERDGRTLHKRAVSAPDFAGMAAPVDASTAAPSSDSQAQSSNDEPSLSTLIDAYNPLFVDTFQDFFNDLVSLENQRSDIENELLDKKEDCKFPGGPCVLRSQPRKAISHLFGRNKTCTRRIPSHVWVHFCRKHYQRSKYRNSDEFSLTQAELVLDTLFRAQVWSDMNAREARLGRAEGKTMDSPCIIVSWSLSTRKREQKRIEDQERLNGKKRNANNKRRRADDDDESDLDVDLDTDNGDGDFAGNSPVGHDLAVDGWLLDKCGHSYTTLQMMEIVVRIKTELMEKKRTKMPDIEILPNMEGGAQDQSKPRPPRKPATHKRSQSMGVGTHSRVTDRFPTPPRRISQPNVDYWRNAHYSPPAEKRQRLGAVGASLPPIDSSYDYRMARRVQHSTVPQIQQPAFANIPEGQVNDNFDQRQQLPATSQGLGTPMIPGMGPLPAPQGLAPQQSRYSGGVSPHVRSFSDFHRPGQSIPSFQQISDRNNHFSNYGGYGGYMSHSTAPNSSSHYNMSNGTPAGNYNQGSLTYSPTVNNNSVNGYWTGQPSAPNSYSQQSAPNSYAQTSDPGLYAQPSSQSGMSRASYAPSIGNNGGAGVGAYGPGDVKHTRSISSPMNFGRPANNDVHPYGYAQLSVPPRDNRGNSHNQNNLF